MHDRLGEDGNSQASPSLVQSMRLQGQKQPALGRQVRDSTEHDVELIYGARRLAAARELGVDLLVEVRDIDDRDALIEMDIENRVREDISPYERGISYKRWLRSGMFGTQAEIAKALGISEAQICRLLKYADLPAAVVAAFKSPREIREEWAGTLSSVCKDARFRESMLRRARSISASSRNLSPQEVYESLVHEGRSRIVRARARDEIVKGTVGQPLFRIRSRAKTVHFIVPRDTLCLETLDVIVQQLKASLESVNRSSASAEPDMGRPVSAARSPRARSGKDGKNGASHGPVPAPTVVRRSGPSSSSSIPESEVAIES